MWKLLRGDWYDVDEKFTLPTHTFQLSQTVSDLPLKEYYDPLYQFLIKRTLSRHSLEGIRTLHELKYENYDDELSWICSAEFYIMSLYNLLVNQK